MHSLFIFYLRTALIQLYLSNLIIKIMSESINDECAIQHHTNNHERTTVPFPSLPPRRFLSFSPQKIPTVFLFFLGMKLKSPKTPQNAHGNEARDALYLIRLYPLQTRRRIIIMTIYMNSLISLLPFFPISPSFISLFLLFLLQTFWEDGKCTRLIFKVKYI